MRTSRPCPDSWRRRISPKRTSRAATDAPGRSSRTASSTIHRALALHVAEAVRAALARLEIEVRPDGSRQDAREASDREGSDSHCAAAGPVAPQEREAMSQASISEVTGGVRRRRVAG